MHCGIRRSAYSRSCTSRYSACARIVVSDCTGPVLRRVHSRDDTMDSAGRDNFSVGSLSRASSHESVLDFKPKPPTTPPSELSSSGALDRISMTMRRGVIMDEDIFEEAFLKCTICCDRYGSALKVPKLLPCHHTFCMQCLTRMAKVEEEYRRNISLTFSRYRTAVMIQCPTCRASFFATDDTLQQLSTDHKVVQLLDFLNTTNRYTINFCSKHHLQALNFFCETCIVPVCRDCTVLDHKESKGHRVMDMDKALQRYMPLVEQTLKETEKEVDNIKKLHLVFAKGIAKLDNSKRQLREDIRKTFDELQKALADREQMLLSISDQGINKDKKWFTEKLEHTIELESNLQSHIDSLKCAREANDVEAMFKIHTSIRENASVSSSTSSSCLDSIKEEVCLTVFQFNIPEENEFLQSISNYGGISSQTEHPNHFLRWPIDQIP